MNRYILSLVFLVLLASTAFAQTKTPFEGVWKISEQIMPSTKPAEKGAVITNPQPSLIIFSRGYYSEVFVRGEKPRAAVAPAKDPQNLTDDEKIARYEQWRQFAANAGTYQIKGSTLIRRSIVAKNVNLMTRGTGHIQEFKFEGPNTLWLIPTVDESTIEPRIKLTRLE
jgi:hypothetical protein